MEKNIITGQTMVKKAATTLFGLALMLGVLFAAVTPAGAQEVSLEVGDQAAQSGAIEQEFSVSGNGDNSNQCVGFSGSANSGNLQNQQGVLQSNTEADDVEFSGGSIALSPEQAQECEQKVQQAAAASATAPKAEEKEKAKERAKAKEKEKVPPKTEAKVEEEQQAEAKAAPEAKAGGTEAKTGGTKAKELPNTGGGALTILGGGTLLVAGGLLVRKFF